jgi:hypothetical protein
LAIKRLERNFLKTPQQSLREILARKRAILLMILDRYPFQQDDPNYTPPDVFEVNYLAKERSWTTIVCHLMAYMNMFEIFDCDGIVHLTHVPGTFDYFLTLNFDKIKEETYARDFFSFSKYELLFTLATNEKPSERSPHLKLYT